MISSRITQLEHQRIVFNGNGYSDEWVAEEAAETWTSKHQVHGRCNSCLYVAPESVAAFEKFGVFTKTELESSCRDRV